MLSAKYPFRLIRSFLTNLNGKKIWEDYWNGLDSQERETSFRIDLPLQQPVELDDVGKLDYVRQEGKMFLSTLNFESLRLTMLAAQFFFELERTPFSPYRDFEYQGAIYCRSSRRRDTITKLLQDFSSARFILAGASSNSTLGKVADGRFCVSCGAFRMGITLHTNHPGQTLSISIRFNDFHQYRISGFPNPLSWFMERQQIDNVFGFSDDRSSWRTSGFSCCQYGQAKLKRKHESSGARQRKRQKVE